MLSPTKGRGFFLALVPFLQRHERRVAAGGGGVDRQRLLGREAVQVARAAGLGAGAGETLAAEGLHADHGADHAAVTVGVADRQAAGALPHRRLLAAWPADG